MHIHLNDSDISQMPEALRTLFLHWLPEYLKVKRLEVNQVSVSKQASEPEAVKPASLESQTSEEKADHSRVKLTQLFDAGITKRGMSVRVKLMRKLAQQQGCEYINSLQISPKGTIIYNGQEFDQPSPLAAKVNSGAANGWEYIEIKKNDEWVHLGELREIWRKSNDQK